MDKAYLKRNILNFKSEVLDGLFATKEELEEAIENVTVSGADVPSTDIDFSNWEGGNE